MKRLQDTGADDARDDHEPTRHKSSDDTADDTVPMAQEPSSGSGVKRSNLEAIRHADGGRESSESCKIERGTTSSETSICNIDG